MSTDTNTSGMFTSLLALDIKFMNTSERQYFNTVQKFLHILGTDLQFITTKVY